MKNNTSSLRSRMYTTADLMTILNLSLPGVYDLLREQAVKQDFVVKRIGRQYRVERSSFDRWLYGSEGNDPSQE